MSAPSRVKWVALFSGQGNQRAEHVRRLRASLQGELADAWQRALASIDIAAETLDDRALLRNRVAQPTLVAWQVSAYAAIANALPPPVLVAGYSVGEIAACSAAGGYDVRAAIELAATRARLMDEAIRGPSGLAAVLGLPESTVRSLCERTGTAIAIRNGPRHFVAGGPQAPLEALIAAAMEEGATRACALPVTTAAHTLWLAPAVPRFALALQAIGMEPLRVPMLSGIDASRLRTADEAASALARQLATPLDWQACMESVAEMQPDAVLEIGPGNALARMLAEAAPELAVRAMEDFRETASAVAWVLRRHG